jgi:hypothetical protein
MPDQPVVCKLSEPELQQRRAQVLEAIRAHIQEIRPLDSGWALRFHSEDTMVEQLLKAIELERLCCPFLRFRLTLEPDGGPLWLELTGPPGTKELLATELRL